MPVVEQWFGENFAFRIGGDVGYVKANGDYFAGGVYTGITLRLGPTKNIDADVNYTSYKRPGRSSSENIISQGILFGTIGANGVFKK